LISSKREQKKELEKIYLSNHTVRCHISVMSCDILDQGSPTWYPKAPGRPKGPSKSPAGFF